MTNRPCVIGCWLLVFKTYPLPHYVSLPFRKRPHISCHSAQEIAGEKQTDTTETT